MDYPKSIPSVGLVNGKFVDENPVAGTPGSLIPSAWGNSVTQEMLNVIKGASLSPAEADTSQLLKAINALAQAGATNYALDTGVADAYQATFSPAITALTDGLVVKIKIKTNNTGASTFSPDGLVARRIVSLGHDTLQGGELVAGGFAWLHYNSSHVNGSWVLIASSNGASPVVAGTKSNHAVNFSQLGSLNGLKRILNASTTLVAADIGALVSVEGASGSTQTLMSIATLPTGASISFTASSAFTLQAGGADQISIPTVGNVTSIQMDKGDTISVTRDPTRWWASSYSQGAGRLLNVQKFGAVGTFTYSSTPGTKSIVVEVQGAGGAGGGVGASPIGQAAVAPGGNAGAYSKTRITGGFNGATVTVGAQGLGRTGLSGLNGGFSSFGPFVSAPGGEGGTYYPFTTPPMLNVNASGQSIPTAGTIVMAVGSRGAPGCCSALNYGGSGDGGGSPWGSGGQSAPVPANGFRNGFGSICAGAGGSGAASSNGGGAAGGGNGGDGIVMVWEYS